MKTPAKLDETATALSRNRCQRLSPWYDQMEGMSEKRFMPWRRRLWSQIQGLHVLEVGVGTGKNMPVWCKYSIHPNIIENHRVTRPKSIT